MLAQIELGGCEKVPAPNANALKAEQALDRADLKMAQLYINALERKSPDQKLHGTYLKAEWNLMSGKLLQAAELFQAVYNECPNYNPDLAFKLASLWARQGLREKAESLFLAYLMSDMGNPDLKGQARDVIRNWELVDSLKSHPVPYEPFLIEGLHEEYDEFLGVLSPDERSWFFTRRQNILDLKSGPAPIRRQKEEFCSGDNMVSGVQNIKVLDTPFNQGFNEGGPSITADNRWMAITSCKLQEDGYRNCDIFLAQYSDGEWSNFIPLTTVNRPNSWESQPSISANGDHLIFSSNRTGGLGGLDLYEVWRMPNGSWSEPSNLGNRINTAGDDKSPFLHADGHTLFFSSNGLPGMGDFDVYWVDLHAANLPKNIGYPVNTDKAEVGFAVASKSPFAYFSSNEQIGKLPSSSVYNFYGFTLPNGARADQVAFVHGNVASDDIPPEGLSLRIENLQTRKVTRVRVDASSGTYTAVLTNSIPSDYVVSIEDSTMGFTGIRINLDTSNQEIIVPELVAKRVQVGEHFSLNSIQFTSNSFQMSALDKASLAPFVAYLQAHPNMTIELQGHTDNMGNSSGNQLLSQRRAEAVLAYLLSQGVPASRMSAKGYGDSQPVADNNLPEGRAKNRRTVFEVLTK